MRLIRKSQSATEYAIFIAAVLVGLLALQVYYSRAVKGNVKSRADSIGEQFDTKDGYNLETRSVSQRSSSTGYDASNTNAYSNSTIATSLNSSISTEAAQFSPSLTTKYAGGEISQTDYVDVNGVHTNATTGNFSDNTVKSAWDDANNLKSNQ